MVRLEFPTELNYEVGAPGADFIFNVQAARIPRQAVVTESQQLSQIVPQHVHHALSTDGP